MTGDEVEAIEVDVFEIKVCADVIIEQGQYPGELPADERLAMILVTGATGTVGREVVNLLLDDGEKVAAVTRDPATAALPSGAHVVDGDPSRPKTLTSALRGVEAVFLNPAAIGGAIVELLTLAAEQGAERVVLLSGAAMEYGDGKSPLAEHFKTVENAVKASGLQWTFLRAGEFAANTLAWAPQIRSTGVVRDAYGDAATSPIHERDIAAVGVRALVDSAHAGHSYLLHGPRSLTKRDKVRLIGEATGKQLSFEEISPQQARQAMIAQGVPEPIADSVLGYQAETVQHPGPSSATVEQVLGRPALTYAEWAAHHAAAFRN